MEAWRDVIRLWLRARFRKTRVNRDLDDEFEFHLDRHADALEDDGMPAKDAHQIAREELGDVEALKRRTRDAADEGSRLALDEWRLLTMLPRSVNFKILVATLVILGAVTGYVVSRLQPPLYQAEARLTIAPPQVATDLVVTSPPAEFSLEAIMGGVLSRRRLADLADDFALYPDLSTPEDRAGKLRSHVVVTPSVLGGRYLTIGFTGTDPTTVMKVTEKLAAFVRDEGIMQQVRMAENTNSFLESQVEEAGRRLTDHLARAKASNTAAEPRVRLETEAFESTYRQFLTNLEAARTRVNLERRQLGQHFILLDPARTPERPITLTPMQQAGVGALAGLSLAILIAAVVLAIRLWRRPTSPMAELA